jgi:5-methylcytosine-specific restriction endonuclease McrA
MDGKLCAQCNEVRSLNCFSTNGPSQSLRRLCRRCCKANARRKAGCRLRSEIHADGERRKLELANNRKKWLCCNLIAEHPDRGWARQYTNGLYRAKYARDPDAERQRMQVYKQAHPDVAGRHLGGSNRLKAATVSDGTLTREVLRAMIAGAVECAYCGVDLRTTKKSFEHVIPLSRGGLHSIGNVIVCCWPCNRSKHARTPEEWRASERTA